MNAWKNESEGMRMEIRTLLFDFDDTLGNREVYAYKAYEEAVDFVKPGMDPMEKEAVLQTCMILDQQGDINKNYVSSALRERFGIDLDVMGNPDFNQWWETNLWKYTELFPDAMEVLNELRKRGYRLGVVTNGTSYSQHQKLAKGGLDTFFDAVVVSGDLKVKKPNPEIFRYAAEKIGSAPQDCAFIGDLFARDIIGAYRAGMKPIWIWPHGQRMMTAECTRIQTLKDLLDLFR